MGVLTWAAGTSPFYVRASDERYTVDKHVNAAGITYVAWFKADRITPAEMVGPVRASAELAQADAQRHADAASATREGHE